MKYLSSYKIIKESVAEAKSFWSKTIGNTIDNFFLPELQKVLYKNPGYIGPFLKLIFSNYNKKGGKLEKYISGTMHQDEIDYLIKPTIPEVQKCYDLIIKHKQLFSNLDISNFVTFEKLEDYLNNTIIHSNRLQFVKKFISSKYMHLINDDTLRLFDDLRKVIGDDHSTFNSIVLSKIASFKNSTEFNSFLNNYLRQFGDWNVDSLEQKAIKYKANIVYKTDTILIIETPTWESLKMLGSQNWCIVRDVDYWMDYLYNIDIKVNLQYIIFDTNLDQSNVNSMIGVTVAPDGTITAAHLLDDYEAEESDYIDYLSYLKPISREDLRYEFEMNSDDTYWIFTYRYPEKLQELKDESYNFKQSDSEPFRYAAENGNSEVVEWLLQNTNIDPNAKNGYAIMTASENEHIETVQVLLNDPRVDASVRDNSPIKNTNNPEIIRLLAKDPSVQEHAGLTEKELLSRYL